MPRSPRYARSSRHVHCTAAVAVLTLSAVAAQSPAAVPAGADAVAAMEKFLAHNFTPRQYSAARRLEASGSGQRGWLDVQTDFSPGSGLEFEVTAEGGSGYIRSRVLRSLLEEEQRLIARGASADVALSADNYEFTPGVANADGLVTIALKPRRKERSLILGTMFLTAATGDLVRVEGRLAKSPSFWLKRVTVERSYRRLNGVLVPVSLHSTGQLRFLGGSTLRMSYDYSEVDHRPVTDGAAQN